MRPCFVDYDAYRTCNEIVVLCDTDLRRSETLRAGAGGARCRPGVARGAHRRRAGARAARARRAHATHAGHAAGAARRRRAARAGHTPRGRQARRRAGHRPPGTQVQSQTLCYGCDILLQRSTVTLRISLFYRYSYALTI